MRIVMDLQACQTEGSRHRGVGRYSLSFAIQFARLKGEFDLRFAYSESYPFAIDEILDGLETYVPRQRATGYSYPRLLRAQPGERNTRAQVAEILISQHWLSLQPDILHISHVFEGLAGEAVIPHRLPKVAGLLRSATLYDLIPLRFPEIYFADGQFRQWYLEKLGTLRDCDLLLAISESSRNDAIELLNIQPEKIVTIWGGLESHFQPQEIAPPQQDAFRQKFKLRDKFILFTGGDEYRKNIEGAITGFARLPRHVRENVQLVVVCNMAAERRTFFLGRAKQCGLTSEDVLFVGFVSEEDLVTFYNLCEVFVYPSLYEGLGLPVLEGMACGAPVIAANNSSIREIVVREDALFDTKSAESMAEMLARVLGDKNFRDDLRRSGLERAKTFTWERTARLASEAFDDARLRLSPTGNIFVTNSLVKKNLAVFTPLPPCRSGVADYNAAFLPFLATHFNIEIFVDNYKAQESYIEANFPIHSHDKFPQIAEQFDVVMYEMGNSEFHAYMLNYLERYPGIVMLHDAYLSGLYGYLEFYAHQTHRYIQEMLHAHGCRARRYLAPIQEVKDPISESMIKLPCTKRVLDSAIGVISHSPFNVEVAKENYPEGWAAPYRVINQMVRIPAIQDEEKKQSLRSELGFKEGDFIICTFGHIAWTKCGDTVLEAFGQSLATNPSAKLVYVGELAKDDFGGKLKNAIQKNNFKTRVRVTGYLSEGDYEKYLIIANLGVQLRQHSRGGTPKGVLDCLAHGVPVIVNNNASYLDYPDHVMVKISATPVVSELAGEFNRLSGSLSDLRRIATAGRSYVEQHHHPEAIAALYAKTINEFVQRNQSIAVSSRIREASSLLVTQPSSAPALEEVAQALHWNLTRPIFNRRRVLVDVSHIADLDHGTGIQRVVRTVVRWFYCSNRGDFEPVAVRLFNGKLVEASAWLDASRLLTGGDDLDHPAAEISLQPGDLLLMLDSSWGRIDEFLPVFEAIRQVKGKVYTAVYDLLPIKLAQTCFPPGAAEWFQAWLEKAVDHSDAMICISKATADDVDDFIRARPTNPDNRGRSLQIGYWHLGCDFDIRDNALGPTARMIEALSRPTFFMVGTLEPRKGHGLALQALETLWARDINIGLCIAGKRGWMVEDLIERIACHPELNKRLYFIEQPTDDELQYGFTHALALLFPSAGEGFGLPLIEAARFGTPIIASGLPVLREIAGPHATYFSLGTALELAETLEQWMENAKSGTIPDSRKIASLTWEQSAEQLLDVVLDNHWYKSISKILN